MSSFWGMVLQWGSTIRVSIELPSQPHHDWKIVESDVKPEQTTTTKYQHCSSVMASFFILEFLPRQILDQIGWKMLFGKTLSWSLSISMCMQNVIEIFQKVLEIEPVLLLSEFGPWQSLDRWQMAFWQSLGLDLLNINDFAKFHRKISHASRTYVTYEKLMSELMLHVFSKKWCYKRKCNMSDLMLENV